ncbi:hypothetical protein SAY87_016568 [Trapa incisa]|uniref:Uncharacterized protein n=1 Tax=Trapa incisa TaxID=236973 RepID=A0AAN7L686_9MYRT|nr:hypothetical protein SAY87_016568 [Trapa incisa]
MEQAAAGPNEGFVPVHNDLNGPVLDREPTSVYRTILSGSIIRRSDPYKGPTQFQLLVPEPELLRLYGPPLLIHLISRTATSLAPAAVVFFPGRKVKLSGLVAPIRRVRDKEASNSAESKVLPRLRAG